MACPSCGRPVPEGARFCPACGQPLVSRPDERRVATVLFADLVGFTTFAEAADPEQVKRLVDRCFEALSRDVTAFGGQVDKIVGDELVALFGAPVAHEDDAERAVRCALQMQRTLAGLRDGHGPAIEMRVGVNTGEVLVGALRAGGDYTAMGDVVNTAHRIQVAAPPGAVVVGGATHVATEHAVRYEHLGSLTVKGREEQVEAWRALAVVAPPGRRRRRLRNPLVGREAELSLLSSVVDRAVSRSRAHLVLVNGDAGIGKSRLVDETVARAQSRHDAVVLDAQCVPYGEDVWWPIAEVVREAAGLGLDEHQDEVRARLCETVARATGRPAEDPEVVRVARGLLYLLGYESELHDLDPQRARDEAQRSVQALFEATARRAPVLAVVSDLQWADDVVLSLLLRLVTNLRGLPFVLFTTARPEFTAHRRADAGRLNLTVVHLDPLDADEVAELTATLLGPDAGPELAALLCERSGGNPFFVEELAALLRESGPPAPGPRSVTALPATLQALVTARLDGLEPALRGALDDCAIVGAAGSVDSVAALVAARAPSTVVADALDALVERELLDVDDGEFTFASELVRDVAYGMLSKAERARRHAALAEWLDGRLEREASSLALERVAHHYGTAAELEHEIGAVDGVPADLAARASTAIERAADRAREGEVWRTASRLYERALAVLTESTPVETRWRLQLGHADSCANLRELDRARGDLDDVLEEAPPDGPIAAEALTLLGTVQQMTGEYGQSRRTLDDALARWRALADEQGAAQALRARGRTATFAGDLATADADFTEALALFRRGGDRRGEAWAIQNLATISFFRGEAADAERRLAAAAEVFTDLGDWGGLNFTYSVLGWVRYMQGRYEEAERLALEQLPESEAIGNAWVVGILDMLLASLALWSGRAEAAAARGVRAVEHFRSIGDPWGESSALGVAMRALGGTGRVADALVAGGFDPEGGLGERRAPSYVPELIRAEVLVHAGSPHALPAALHVRAPDDRPGAEAGRTLGLALLQAGRLREAVAALEDAFEADRHVDPGSHVASAAALAIGYAAAGRTDDVRALVDELGPGITYLDRLQFVFARALRALSAGDEHAATSFDELVAAADATDAALDRTWTRVARARAHELLGRPDAPGARADAVAWTSDIGLDTPGWETVVELAAGAAGPRSRGEVPHAAD